MSLTTASICISNYLGVPTELMNIITQYAATNDNKWVPHFDTAGTLHKKINGHAFATLSRIYEMRVYSRIYTHVLVLNGVISCRSLTRMIYVDEYTRTLYTKSEIYPGVFDYYTITYDSSSSSSQNQLKSGSVHMSGFTQSQAVTSFHMHGNEMWVSIIDEYDQEEEYDDYDDF
jgi:hypothetical protein